MGGVNIDEDIVIDKSIHKSINSRSAVLKVNIFQLPTTFIGIMIVILSREDVTTQYQHCMLHLHLQRIICRDLMNIQRHVYYVL